MESASAAGPTPGLAPRAARFHGAAMRGACEHGDGVILRRVLRGDATVTGAAAAAEMSRRPVFAAPHPVLGSVDVAGESPAPVIAGPSTRRSFGGMA